MDYLFENLGPDKFQKFCQSILISEFPNVQCYPVNEKDGGRDATVIRSAIHDEFYVFQMKFVRDYDKITNRKKWLEEIIQAEIPKIKELVKRGATRYFLLTNVRGTASLDNGTIDLFNSIVSSLVDIQCSCWWRDDLSRRFENTSGLKWFYPELLSAKDLIDGLIFNSMTESKERRESVIRAYLKDQYDSDYEVKFKQIELQNSLLDLFVDVPITMNRQITNKSLDRISHIFRWLQHTLGVELDQGLQFEDTFLRNDQKSIGAVKFLINEKTQENFKQIVIEGGPGQGKSTIVQFLCQVHRIRLLNRSEQINKLEKYYIDQPLRIPFKIDLRDLASWLVGVNPYQITETDEPKISKDSLESFIVEHIRYHAGNIEFDNSDLIAILKESSALFVFDGFDEVADIKIRNLIVQKITLGIGRLTENSTSLQVIITSRPAAFANSVGFSIDNFPLFELGDINKNIINYYLDNWINARKLSSRESSLIRRTVNDKLDLPHLRDLAKNPMQLAILISLINTKGQSLPDKRTALYDDYLRLFFDRESEKNTTIRDNRDLIINIHEYLAWVLHYQAEISEGNGRISLEKLQTELASFLRSEGHDVNVASKLFTAIQERVCAIVSRVQNTFEFEVQPLREYFCAKYLYHTAPYSPVGNERQGTHPDRFEALSSNFYWTNVVRFYTGCFSKGELPMLISKLEELVEMEDLKHTSHPRLLASLILSDWVFSQYPKLMHRVVRLIIDGIGLRFQLISTSRGSGDSISLPEKCGRDELFNEGLNQLKLFPPGDYASELIVLIVSNNRLSLYSEWLNYFDELEDENNIIKWLEYGLRLHLIHRLDGNSLEKISSKLVDNHEELIRILLFGNKYELIGSHYLSEFLEFVLSGRLDRFFWRRPSHHSLLMFSIFLTAPHSFNDNDRQHSDFGFDRIFKNIQTSDPIQIDLGRISIDDQVIVKSIQTWLEAARVSYSKNVDVWMRYLDPWIGLVDNGIRIFGNKWVFYGLACSAAGIKSSTTTCSENSDFLDESQSLVKRTRYARLRSGNANWWKKTLVEADSDIRDHALLVFIKWSTVKALRDLLYLIDDMINVLDEEIVRKLYETLNNTSRNAAPKKGYKLVLESLLTEEVCDNTAFLISTKLDHYSTSILFQKRFMMYNGDNCAIHDFNRKMSLEIFLSSKMNMEYLDYIRELYAKSSLRKKRDDYNHGGFKGVEIPLKIARVIMSAPESYPRLLVTLAERACKTSANSNIVPVGIVAERDNWFSEF